MTWSNPAIADVPDWAAMTSDEKDGMMQTCLNSDKSIEGKFSPIHSDLA